MASVGMCVQISSDSPEEKLGHQYGAGVDVMNISEQLNIFHCEITETDKGSIGMEGKDKLADVRIFGRVTATILGFSGGSCDL